MARQDGVRYCGEKRSTAGLSSRHPWEPTTCGVLQAAKEVAWPVSVGAGWLVAARDAASFPLLASMGAGSAIIYLHARSTAQSDIPGGCILRPCRSKPSSRGLVRAPRPCSPPSIDLLTKIAECSGVCQHNICPAAFLVQCQLGFLAR